MKKTQIAFNAGIVSPELFGRMDLDKYQTGLADCVNMRVLPHGPVIKRGGMRYVLNAQDETKPVRLIPFSISADVNLIVEFGHGYYRVYSNGGVMLRGNAIDVELSGDTFTSDTQIFELELMYLQWTKDGVQQGRYVYVRSVSFSSPTYSFTLESSIGGLFGGDLVPIGATDLQIYETHSYLSPYDADDLFDLTYVQNASTLTIAHPKYRVRELQYILGSGIPSPVWVFFLDVAVFAPSVQPPQSVYMTVKLPSVTLENGTAHYYKVTALTAGGIEESVASGEQDNASETVNIANAVFYSEGVTNPRKYTKVTTATAHDLQSGDVVVVADVGGMTDLNASWVVARVNSTTELLLSVNSEDFDAYTSGGTLTYGQINNLSQKGAYNTVNWTAVSGADRYNVYKKRNGIYGYIGQTSDLTFKDDNITPDLNKTPPESVNPFSGTGNYPSTVCYFEQRKCFAATDNQPQTIWMTRPATERNLSSSLPTNDGDAISFRIAAREQNRVRHLVPIDDLIAFTVGSEFRIYTNGDVVAPSTIAARPQTYTGANKVQPVTTNGTVLYVNAQGDRVRELGYAGDAGSRVYRSNDLCRLTPSIFDDHTVVDMTYVGGAQSTLWCVRDDGVLLSMTYLPEERVLAWSQHSTAGLVESVAATFEGGYPVLYCVVKRTINESNRRYIEKIDTWRTSVRADAFYVDSGLSYAGDPVSTVSGLEHLEGMNVVVLADGVKSTKTVTDGTVYLDIDASKIHIGLAYTALIKTLPMALDNLDGVGRGYRKNINKAWVNVVNSAGIKSGLAGRTYEAKERTTEVYGTPPNLQNGLLEVPMTTTWSDGAQLVVEQSEPLPMTIVGLTLEVNVGG